MGTQRISGWRLLGASITAMLFVSLSLSGAETTPSRASDPGMESLRQAVLTAWATPDAVITEIERRDAWAYGALVDTQEDAFITGEGTQFVAQWRDNAWEVAFEGAPALRALLPNVPAALLPVARKSSLDYSSLDPTAPLHASANSPQDSNYKLPWPAGNTYYITRAWATGACNHGSHAVDVSMPIGNPVVAMRSGIVMVAEQVSSDCGCTAGNASNKIIIRHIPDDDLYDWYAHVGHGTITAQVGDYVEQGQVLALSNQVGYTCGSGTCAAGTCNLGNCLPGPHLHFHVENGYGERIFINFADAGVIQGCTWVTSGNDDQSLPTVRLTGGPNAQTWVNSNQTISWSIEDESGVWGYSAAWDALPTGPPPAVLQTTGLTDFSGLAPGQHNLNIRAWDLAPTRHERLAEFGWFGFDPIPPTAPAIAVDCSDHGRLPASAACRDPQFRWRSVEEHSGLSGAQAGYRFAWQREGEPSQFSAWQGKDNYMPLLAEPGLFRLDVQARDLAGNESSLSSLAYRLGDYVWDDRNGNGIRESGEPGIPGVLAKLYPNIACSGVAVAAYTTSADGLYLFTDLAPGAYCVQINEANFNPEGVLAGWQSSPQDQGDDDTLDSDGDVNTHQAIGAVAASNVTPGLDFGFWRAGCLGDFIFLDPNTNGLQDGCTDPADPFSCAESDGIAGVPIHISGPGGLTVTVISSFDPPGLYLVSQLLPGAYTVAVPANPLPHLWLTTPAERTVTLAPGACERQLDFGFVSPTGLTLQDLQLAWVGSNAWITWQTMTETGVTGFDIYRARAPLANRTRVNATLIPAHGPGQPYSLEDTTVWSGAMAWYWLVVQPRGEWLGPWRLDARRSRQIFLPLLLDQIP